MTVRYLVLMAVAVATPSLAQQAPPSVAAGAKARAGLDAILQSDGIFESGNSLEGAYTEGRLYTRPVSTGFPGVCRRDMVAVGYADVKGGQRTYTDMAEMPFGLRAKTEYRIITGEAMISLDRPRDYQPFKGPCTAIDGMARDGWISADSSWTVAYGYNALMIALGTIREGKRAIPGCHDKKGRISRECSGFVSSAFPGDVTDIRQCVSKPPDPCYAFTVGNYWVTIQLEYRPSPRLDVLRSIVIEEDNTIMVQGTP
ncbi:hypothetical protein [Sphingomonas sp. G-3-2-10]|uniref:hypothetical protein n=1 Tax=Sphingomonas sp. G-3-2-10 TaxID=2728838 RepID=UPI00146C84AE|nr:hypothetical protein [Sphingomonas sp. G-3-2-10]NML05269.1 hypothetical protein [Sphingomonas sp. G-3-2-10]